MRILAAFFSVLFTFINPTMFINEAYLNMKLPSSVRIGAIDLFVGYLTQLNIRLKFIMYCIVIMITLLHIMFTCLSMYGIYACRPKFMKPLLFDIFSSLFYLLAFVLFSLLMYWRLNTLGSIADRDACKQQLRNVYIAVGFLIAYLVWAIVSVMAYTDTKKMRADFMYWIEEERMSMRSRHNVSVDNRSDRSSKGSKASRASKTSNKSNRSAVDSPMTAVERRAEYQAVSGSCNTSMCKKKMSITNARLSVPL